jgi:NADPH:quinone reductase-like Zn-dependent oxidoreductase
VIEAILRIFREEMKVQMKAVRIHEFGGADVLKLEDVAVPTPARDEVLVRVRAAAVNPIDWKVRSGATRAWLDVKLPMTLGCDIAGVVEETGADVGEFKKGDAVYGTLNLARGGGYAEFAIAKENEIALKPTSVDFKAAASLCAGALTAWQALFDTAKLDAGQIVLIHAAAGGVGSLAVQLAKWKGARVFATASARNAEFVKNLGADEFIDYTTTRFETVAKNVDVVLDTIGGETQARSLAVLKPRGWLVSIVNAPSAEEAAKHNVHATMISMANNAAQLVEIARLVDEGLLKPTVETVLPLAEARRAHELSESGRARGKIVLQIGE